MPLARIELASFQFRREVLVNLWVFRKTVLRLTLLVFARHQLWNVLDHCTKGAEDYFLHDPGGLYSKLGVKAQGKKDKGFQLLKFMVMSMLHFMYLLWFLRLEKALYILFLSYLTSIMGLK